MVEPYTATFISDESGNKFLGAHVILEVCGADPRKLVDFKTVRDALIEAAKAIGATVLSDHFHEFPGGGLTGALILSESHITIHTWPEYEYAAIDIFTCGKCDPLKGIKAIENGLSPRTVGVTYFRRGQSGPAV